MVTAIALGPLPSRAQNPDSTAPRPTRCLTLDLYIRSDSQACRDAVQFAEAFATRRRGICLRIYDVTQSKDKLASYWKLMREYRVKSPLVPAFVACGQLKLGFQNEEKSSADIARLFAVHAYTRATCSHCRAAKRYLAELGPRWPAVQIVFHDVDREPHALQEMTALASRHGIAAPSLPTISICGRIISGYQSDSTTGRRLEQLLLESSIKPLPDRTKEAHGDKGTPPTTSFQQQTSSPVLSRVNLLVFSIETASIVASQSHAAVETMPPATDELPSDEAPLELPTRDESTDSDQVYIPPTETPEGIEVPWLGHVRVRDLGLPAFTLLVGLIDGFNPCAMWVLVFLLSVLVNIKDRKKIAAIAITFVIVSGLAYFAFMAAWLNLFMLVGIARPIQIALGLLAIAIGVINIKDFFAFKRGVTLSIPEAAKPGIYARVRRIVTTEYLSIAIGFSVILAVFVNMVELLCTAGLPAVYTQILSIQQLPAWQNYVYLALYILGYMFDDGLLVATFLVTLSHRKMRESEGRWLKLVSGLVVLGLGAALLFRPDWLQW